MQRLQRARQRKRPDEIAVREPHGSKPAQIVFTLWICFEQAGFWGAGGAYRFRAVFAGLAPTDAERDCSEGSGLRFAVTTRSPISFAAA